MTVMVGKNAVAGMDCLTRTRRVVVREEKLCDSEGLIRTATKTP